ncbi:MAG: zinc dependent phospholipase C family protein [Halanaerobiales bacterium]
MPGFWTHIIAGDLIIDEIENTSLKNMIKSHKKFFNLGCQGPDFLYFNNFWPWKKNTEGNKAGGVFHTKKIKKLFFWGIDYIKQKKNNDFFEQLLIYFYGYATHYIIDSIFHEYICKITDTSEDHVFLEIKLDEYLVNKIWNKKVISLNPLTEINSGIKIPSNIEEFFQEALTVIYDYNSEVKFINQSYRDFKIALWILYAPTFMTIKKLGFNIVNYFLTWDINKIVYVNKEEDFPLFKEKVADNFNNLLSRSVKVGEVLVYYLNEFMEGKVKKRELQNMISEIEENYKTEKFALEDISRIISL